MFNGQGQVFPSVRLAAVLPLTAFAVAMVTMPAGAVVTLATGNEANWQSQITGAPANETFIIESGVHRMGALSSPNPQSGGTLTPRSGDTFIGQNGAELRGTKVLPATATLYSGSIYYWGSQTQNSYNPYPDFSLTDPDLTNKRGQCWRGNELFEVDGSGNTVKRWTHVYSLAELNAAGEWFFDDVADRIYIYGNPSNKSFETSVTQTAFNLGTTTGVTLENLSIGHYANLWHVTDAVHGENASNAVFRNIDCSWNHCSAAAIGPNGLVTGSAFFNNGMNGLGGDGHTTSPIFIRGNEIASNGQLPYGNSTNGAMKVVQSIGGIFEQNWVHDNQPWGVWYDVANASNIFRANKVGNVNTTNPLQQRGIFYEIGGDVNKAPTLIYWNEIRESGSAGIDISSSANVSVFENRISTAKGSGITARANNNSDGTPRAPGLYNYRAWGNDVLITDTTSTNRNQHYLESLPGESITTSLTRIGLIDKNTYRGPNRYSYFGNTVQFAPPGWQSNSTDSHHFDTNGTYTSSLTGQPGLPSYASGYVAGNYGTLDGKRTAYWRLDETSGTTAWDDSGNGFNGTLGGNPIWQGSGGIRKGALDLEPDDATSDYVSLGTAPGSASALTVSFWIKPDETNRNMVPISKANNDSSGPDAGKGWAVRLTSSGGVTFRIGGQIVKTDLTAASAYSTGWTHVAATFNAGAAVLYINGAQRASQSGITQTVNNTLTALRLGNNAVGTSEPYDGLLDDVQIFNTALSAAEIRALADDGLGLNPVASWKLNQGTGTVAPDDSGNAHCGTLVNTPAWVAGQQGNALDLNGTTQYVTVPDDAGLDVTGNLTLAAWVKLDNITGYHAILSKNANAYEMNVVDGKLRLELKMADVAGSPMRAQTNNAEIAVGNWYHVAAVRNGATITFYVNGAAKPSGWVSTDAGHTDPIATNTNALEIGRRSAGTLYFDGIIDEAEIYNRALSATEIVAIKDR